MAERGEEAIQQHGFLTPHIDQDSLPWWTALEFGKLILPRCLACGRPWFPPAPMCPDCGSDSFDWIEAGGRGQIYSWVVIGRALHPAFRADAPYTIITVDLQEGPRIVGRLGGDQKPTAGAAVKAEIYRVEGQALLGFVPA